MTHATSSSDLDVALSIVREATVLARAIQDSYGGEAVLKSDRSPVTVADFAIQALVAHRLAETFPDDRLVAEEDAAALREEESGVLLGVVLDHVRRAEPWFDAERLLSAIDRGGQPPGDRFWTLDPIDGTKGFMRGGHYVVALALVERGRPTIGLLGSPRWAFASRPAPSSGPGWIAFARRGAGALAMPLESPRSVWPLRVSGIAAPRSARLLRSVEGGHMDVPLFEKIAAALDLQAPPVLMDSQAKFGVLAAGDADLLLRTLSRPDYRDKIWDVAPGAILVEEAGGRVTDLRGRALDFSAGATLVHNTGIVASNGHLHEAVLEAIAQQADVRRP